MLIRYLLHFQGQSYIGKQKATVIMRINEKKIKENNIYNG